ncbi:MAG: PulJ/GspJ family protein [Candidatus Xenobium sp.]|jgi:hypothetical protein|nr:hypothetical protein [Burkholderiales bacterium]
MNPSSDSPVPGGRMLSELVHTSRRRPSRSWGNTLFEVLVALGLMGLVLTAVGELSVAARHFFAKSTDQGFRFREATRACFQMGRELRMCRELYHPDPAVLDGGQPWTTSPDGSAVIAFRRPGPPLREDQVVGFRLDGSRQVLERLLYQPDFSVEDSSQARLLEPPRRLAGGVVGISLWSPDPSRRHGSRFLGLELVPGAASGSGARTELPLRLEVRVGDL